jgi:hypothetical protein
VGRQATMWFRRQTGWYMTTIGGVQHKLARTAAEARRAFYKLMAKDTPRPRRDRHSVRWVCNRYLDRTKGGKSAETWRVQFGHLRAYCDAFGHRPADSLTAHKVNEWVDATTWGRRRRRSSSRW